MGTIVLKVILVSSYRDTICENWRAAHALGLNPSLIVDSQANGYRSFFVPPSGGKINGEYYADHEALLEQFKTYLRSEDLSPDWVQVSYGDWESERISDSPYNLNQNNDPTTPLPSFAVPKNERIQ